MSLLRVLYVSTSRLAGTDIDAQVARLVDHAVAANAKTQITGALMFDGARFAQLIEGKVAAVSRLYEMIVADTRHRDIVLLENLCVRRRLFRKFSMAYSGRSVFVARSMPMTAGDDPAALASSIDQLTQLMVEFSR